MARDRLGDAVVEIIKVLLTESGESMRALQRASGMKLTRLHSILSAGAPIYVGGIAVELGLPRWVVSAFRRSLAKGLAKPRV